jgi:hypothetical protein
MKKKKKKVKSIFWDHLKCKIIYYGNRNNTLVTKTTKIDSKKKKKKKNVRLFFLI